MSRNDGVVHGNVATVLSLSQPSSQISYFTDAQSRHSYTIIGPRISVGWGVLPLSLLDGDIWQPIPNVSNFICASDLLLFFPSSPDLHINHPVLVVSLKF